MRKTLALILSAVMVLSLCLVGVSAADATEIKTAEEFAAMAADGNYKLGADITLTATYGAGETYTAFNGTLDGQGHTLTISQAVFAEVHGTVKNLTIKGAVTNDKASNTAALALQTIGGTFENITNEASVINSYVMADPTKNETVRTGGLVARIMTTGATFTNCVNKGAVSGAESTGGIAGESQTKESVFTNCVNYGKISTPISKNSGVAAGGILGYSGTASVTYIGCINYGDIETDYRGGGIVGDARKAAVCTDCVNYGNIIGENCCGGIVGYDGDSNTATPTVLTNCVNFGSVSDSNQAGGIIGYLYGNATKAYADIENCINNGTVSGGKYCSEFLGYSNSWNNTIRNSIGAGELKSITVEGFPTIFAIMGCSSTQAASMVIENVYLADNGATQWLSWAAFASNTKVTPNLLDTNARNRIPLSACLGKDLKDVEYEYPVYTSADYTTPSETVKVTANDDISAKNGEEVVGIRVKAVTRIELSDATIKEFIEKTGFTVHLENGKVLPGVASAPVDPTPSTGDNAVWFAVVGAVAILGTAVIVKKVNE